MERRFRIRLEELLNDAEVRPSMLAGVLPRLEVLYLGRMAPSSNFGAAGNLVPDAGDQAGKKYGHPR